MINSQPLIITFTTFIGFVLLLIILSINRPHVQNPLYERIKTRCGGDDPIGSVNGWRPVGHTDEEQRRLQNLSILIAAWPPSVQDNLPTVPAITTDNHLLVLSAAASRIRFGRSATFIMVLAKDMKLVLPKHIQSDPRSSHDLNLWCIFDDGSVTHAYNYDSNYGNDRASLLDCPLSPFASDELWRHNRTIRVYLASLANKTHNAPIIKAFVSVPQFTSTVTLCTSPLHNEANYLKQWILFHYLVGVRKFVVYNSTDDQQQVRKTIDKINRHYPGLIDVVHWNFSSLGLTDALGGRYFQVEALHDCLIRYGEQSEWLGALDSDEYIVPLNDAKNLVDALHAAFGRRVIGSMNLWSYFFCPLHSDNYSLGERNTSGLVIERFISRASTSYRDGREKYLYRPKFVQYLSIHHQIVGSSREDPPEKSLMLAHYVAMSRFRSATGCHQGRDVNDTSIRDEFSQQMKQRIQNL